MDLLYIGCLGPLVHVSAPWLSSAWSPRSRFPETSDVGFSLGLHHPGACAVHPTVSKSGPIECSLYSSRTTFCPLEVLKVLSWFVAYGFARHRHATVPRRFCPVPLRRPDVGIRQSCLPTLCCDGIHLPRRCRRSARATRPSWPSLPRGGLEVSWSRREGESRTSSRSSKGSH